VHCPLDTEHVFVGTGDGPCVIFMTGAKGWPEKGIVNPRSELAIRHGAVVETETKSPPRLRVVPAVAAPAVEDLGRAAVGLLTGRNRKVARDWFRRDRVGLRLLGGSM
jgi:hypothetical protein